MISTWAAGMEGEPRLDYVVEAWSSFSSSHHPSHVLSDTPALQSRWVSASLVYPQFLLLRLHAPAIVTSIRFGKYHKPHLANLKDFRVLGGMEKDPTVEIASGFLRNDGDPETFHTSASVRPRALTCPRVHRSPRRIFSAYPTL